MTGYGGLAAKFRPPVARAWLKQARPEQIPPDGDWGIWMYLAGRGAGKSRSGAEWITDQALTHPNTDWCILAPTFGSARDVCAEGPSGVLKCARRGEVTHYVRSLGEIRLSSGSKIFLRSGDEPDRLRGLNLSGCWVDELASFRYESSWHEGLVPAVRIDPARIVVTTTPRPTPLIKNLLSRQDGSVIVVRGSTWDNQANLSQSALRELQARYEGTRLGRQELGGELLEDVDGALWQLSQIDQDRVDKAPELDRIVIAVDPAVSNNSDSDETGIIVAGVAGKGSDAHFFVLADVSLRGSPHEWATKAINAYHRYSASRIYAEKNQGGLMVESTLRTIDPNVSFQGIHASQGKQLRAEPIAALSEQGRVHHVGAFPALEEQMCSWVPGAGRSPDRVDAMVHAIQALTASRGPRIIVYPPYR